MRRHGGAWGVAGVAAFALAVAGFASAPQRPAPEAVSFPTSDGGKVFALLYGSGGDRGVVLAHGGRFNKESWEVQAKDLAARGFRALAIDFRGYGKSRGPGDADPLSAPLDRDVLAAVRFLRERGAKSVSIIGASMGGGAAADAAVESRPGEIDRVVVLAGRGYKPPEEMKGRKLFILARDDASGSGIPRRVEIQKHFDRCPEPKKLVLLEGTAHAQFLFETDQAERLWREIVSFLEAP